MKRILLGLGCTLTALPGAFAQDGTPAARLRSPAATLGRPAATVRAQAPDVTPAAAFDIPKPMPKGAVSETPGAPGTLPVPGTAGPTLTIPPAGPIPSGPVIIDPPGTPIPSGPIGGAPMLVEPPVPGLIGRPGDPSNWYVAAEAMAVWIKSYSVPALVTTGPAFSGANLAVAGVTSLYGANSVDVNPRFGGKLTLGYWLNPCWAVELSGFYVRPTTHRFTAVTGAFPDLDLARPFLNVNTGAESSEIVGRPGVATGFVQIDEKSNFYGLELNGRNKYWQGCNNKLDLIGGLRFLYLDERLTINEQSTALPAAGAFAGISRAATDQFHTKNRFYGAQIGAAFTHTEGPWTFELTGKVGAGVTRSIVDITGSVTPISGGAPPTLPGGLLALNSNIGSQSHQHFSVVPEIGLNVGYDITPQWRVFAGYSLLYWTGVSRPGNQIDRVLDVNRIPGFPAGAPTTSVRPVAPGGVENLWAQGVSVGLAFRW
jgi:hypothetical protein